MTSATIRHIAAALTLVAATTACHDMSAPMRDALAPGFDEVVVGSPGQNVATDLLAAAIVGDSLMLRNPTGTDVFYFAVERATAATINWAPCVAGTACARIPAMANLAIGTGSLLGHSAMAREVVVFHWTARQGASGVLEPHNLRASIVIP